MNSPDQIDVLTFNSAANYRICAQGFLDESWSERLSGMNIRNRPSDISTPEVVLEGRLSDQAALIGLLNSLYEMHLPLVSVELVKNID